MIDKYIDEKILAIAKTLDKRIRKIESRILDLSIEVHCLQSDIRKIR